MDKQAIGAIALALLTGGGLNACTNTMDSRESAGLAAPTTGPKATAELMDASGAKKGTATLRPMGDGIHIDAEVMGMAPGTYAIHVHTTGTCTPPDFTSAGPHWNPTTRQHGTQNPQGPHKGDLPNLTVLEGGKSARVTSHIQGAAFEGGAGALLDADGASVVVHAAADDYRTDPAGNSGARIVCGVVTRG
jgi:Cu-Zn family superoxide dismutase